MAEKHHPSGDHASGGTMDVTDHVRTWLAFWAGVKWSAIGLLILAALLAYFRTHDG